MGRKADNIKKILVKTAEGEYKEVKDLFTFDGVYYSQVANAYTKINQGGFSSYLKFWTTDPPPEPDYDFVFSVGIEEAGYPFTETTSRISDNSVYFEYAMKRYYFVQTVKSQKDSLDYSIIASGTFTKTSSHGPSVSSHGPGHQYGVGGSIVYVNSDETSTEWWHDGHESEIIDPAKATYASDELMVTAIELDGDTTSSDIIGFTLTNTSTLESVDLFANSIILGIFSQSTFYKNWSKEDALKMKNIMRTAYLNGQDVGLKARRSYEFDA